MAVNKPSRNEQMVGKLIEEVRTLKLEVDESVRTAGGIRERIKRYKAEYVLYIETLDRERIELESRIANCRMQIQRQQEPESGPDETHCHSEEETIADDDAMEDEERIDDTPDTVCIANADDSGVKKRAYHHFAHFFHSDKHMKTPGYSGAMSMQELTLLNRESADEIDFLTAIPWGDEWIRGENESVGSQLERLNDWVDALEKAKVRTKQAKIDLERDIYHSGLTQKQAADERGEDYFAQLSKDHVDEIERLKQTLRDLQTQLNTLESKND